MTAAAPQSAELTLAHLSVAQYHAMRDAGILGEDDAVELLEGLLVLKVTKLPAHSVACALVKDALERILPERFHLRVQDPLTTLDSEPEPDLAVTRGGPRDYIERHPGPADVPLVIEVADDSLPRDRGTKLRLYARGGVREYWIINLRARRLERYREPGGAGYGNAEELEASARVPLVLDGRLVGTIDIAALLP